ncbi:transcriptional regulator [Magnetofaba australis]|uniref:Putative ArsR family transcriptional regulator n=1 Tax=Magnetofaba australis IT-1 TaxID=1434232 RepID=A0A1Y2K2W6_9PROT|nr:transcriptional regulator [Magnetofaba australis]OSM02380.1 putative ArsR family transcriptional regulator [Magnetofaba australis IT-1]
MGGGDLLDPLLHQPVRTRLAALLAGREGASFSELKKALELTDGNLDAHMRKLLQAEYVEAERHGVGPKGQTVYALTAKGRTAFQHYVAALEKLLSLG